MSIAKLRLDESTKLEFGVSITGATGQPKTRLVIEGNSYSISYDCKTTNEGVEVEINELKHVLPAGTYPVRLEVIVENKIYIPFQDQITFEPAVEVSTKPKATQVQVRESIKVDKVVIKETTSSKDKMKVAKAIADVVGYTPKLGESAQAITDNALTEFINSGKSKDESQQILPDLVKLAKQVGISIV